MDLEGGAAAVGAWWAAAWERLRPEVAPWAGTGDLPWIALAVVVALVAVPQLWRRVRVVVTVVHELGHALVGILTGRRFAGLVLRGDMSGHAITVGRERGIGRVLTTWVGYPAPAVVGAVAVRLAGAGWSGPLLGATTLLLLIGLVRVRSWYTAAVMIALTAATGALWWWGGPELRGAVVLGTGAFLLVGAWRHLGAVMARPSAGSDPGVLARLTRVPAWLWVVSFVVVLGAATWWAAGAIGPLAPGAGVALGTGS
ncbi:MAG: M50 family metallopeptidase [Georgenia sp.]